MKRHAFKIAFLFLVLPMGAHGAEDSAKATALMKDITRRLQAFPQWKVTGLVPGESGSQLKMLERRREGKIRCMVNEDAYLELRTNLLASLERAVIARDLEKVKASLAGAWNFSAPEREKSAFRRVDGIEEYRWRGDAKKVAGQDATSALIAWLGEFKTVEDFTVEVFEVEEVKAGHLELLARFDLRGTDLSGWRRNDRLQARLVAGSTKNGSRIESIELVRGETLRAKAALFENVTVAAGLGSAPAYLRNEAIRRGGYALAVGDLDGDTVSDLILGTSEKTVVWKGEKDGKFTEMKVPALNEMTLVKSVVIADLDNDGSNDLVVARFIPDARQEDVVVLKNEGGRFVPRKKGVKIEMKTNYAMPLAVADFNQDGFLDLYAGFPGNRDFTFLSAEVKQTKAVQGIFLNDGTGNFTDHTVKAKLRPVDLGHPARYLFPHSAMAADFDGDGKVDIAVIDDRGNLSPIYRNLGDAVFKEASGMMNLENEKLGMGIAMASTRNDGKFDIVLTNVDFAAGARAFSCTANHASVFRGSGLRFFRNTGEGHFAEATEGTGLEWAGEGLAGAEFFDYNNDGFQDLVVSNGLWSGTSRDEDLASYFVRDSSRLVNPNVLNGFPSESGTRSNYMEVLSSFRGNVRSAKFAKNGPRPSMAGFQRKRLFRNNGDGTFTEIGYMAGMDSIADGYVAAVADVDRDGKTDLLFRHGDPGTKDASFAPLELFRNTHENGRSLTLELEGEPSNGSPRNAAGARVVAKVNGNAVYRTLVINNGSAQSEAVVQIGLGESTRVDELEIRWPSSQVTVHKDLAKGRIRIKEPNKRMGKL
jgi:hypothetical protein